MSAVVHFLIAEVNECFGSRWFQFWCHICSCFSTCFWSASSSIWGFWSIRCCWHSDHSVVTFYAFCLLCISKLLVQVLQVALEQLSLQPTMLLDSQLVPKQLVDFTLGSRKQQQAVALDLASLQHQQVLVLVNHKQLQAPALDLVHPQHRQTLAWVNHSHLHLASPNLQQAAALASHQQQVVGLVSHSQEALVSTRQHQALDLGQPSQLLQCLVRHNL